MAQKCTEAESTQESTSKCTKSEQRQFALCGAWATCMFTSSVDLQLRKIRTSLHSKGSKKCPELYLYAEESQSDAQYPLETKGKSLQEKYQVACVYTTDCQDRSYGSSRLTGINWSI